MIAVSSSSRSFAALGKYLVVGRDEVEEGRVAWTSARNLPTSEPELGAKIMRATAAQNVRVSQPVYHLALSFDPRDVVDRQAMERVADRVLEELKLKEHQAVIVAHGDRAHSHVHILVNRVHPETGRVWDRWQDYPTIQRVLREEERALGVRTVQGTLEQARSIGVSEKQPREHLTQAREEPGHAVPMGADRGTLRPDIDTYLRITELAQQRHSAEREVSAARASLETTTLAIERATRAEAAFDESLRRAYRDPSAAKAGFLKAAEERGVSEAARQMREKPELFGELVAQTSRRGLLRGLDARSVESARCAAREASTPGSELVGAQREVFRAPYAGRDRANLQASSDAAGARAAGQSRLDEARQRAAAIGSEERSMPSRSHLEERLAAGLQRLTPPEFERLRRSLSGQQFNVALKLRQMVRDAALGRDSDA
jgi:hypothetical protein